MPLLVSSTVDVSIVLVVLIPETTSTKGAVFEILISFVFLMTCIYNNESMAGIEGM